MSAAAPPPVVTPSRLGRFLERKFASERALHYLGVQGEVSNLSVQANGNAYFSLKDREAVLNCVAFSEAAAAFPAFDNGADVIAYGEVKIYAKRSVYQLSVSRLELTGIGVLYARFEELKLKLGRAGFFDDDRKRALPRYPFRVALVGSPSGDGTNDFVTQARQRAPHVEIALFPTAVNGPQAAPEITRAIERADASGADLLVLVRGGGSYEDLFGFSDERVVRAVAAARTPTVVAIGHERDVTLAELAADVAASTPSKAAQTVLPTRDDLRRLLARCLADARRAQALRFERQRRRLERVEERSPLADAGRLLADRRQTIDGLRTALGRHLTGRMGRARAALLPLERGLAARSPAAQLERRRAAVARLAAALAGVRTRAVGGPAGRVAGLGARLDAALRRGLELRRTRLRLAEAQIAGNDPHTPLKRGYAMVRAGGLLITDPAEVVAGTRISAELARGTIYARVEGETTDGGKQIGLF